MAKTLYTSDLHLGHANIIKYTGRTQFMSKDELVEYNVMMAIEDTHEQRKRMRDMRISEETLIRHDNVLINNINGCMTEDDTLIHVGDFSFKNTRGGKPGEGVCFKPIDYEKRIKPKIIYIMGNHCLKNGTPSKIMGMYLKDGGRHVYAVHKPEHCNFNYTVNLTGHVHEKWECMQVVLCEDRRFYALDATKPEIGVITHCVNVGVDVWKFYPVDINKIMTRYWRWVNKHKKKDTTQIRLS